MSEAQFPVRFGKYILLDRINSGGMAEVFRAKVTGHEDFQRLLAIKCMLPNLASDDAFSEMFIDEAKLAAQLSHANIVQIYELAQLSGRMYIAMELVDGQNLRGLIKQATHLGISLPSEFAAYVIAKAALGLDAAHRHSSVSGEPLNLVHRDVSPQNILVSYEGEVKVVDFGIAKAEARRTETQAGVLKGKFAYMAPEQVRDGDVDRRTDIFALGLVLYELLTGQKLFQGKSDLAVLEQVRNHERPNLQEVLAGRPPELIECVERCLAKDPKQRYQYAQEAADALSPILIVDRSIFGAKQAKAQMEELFTGELKVHQEKLKHYAQVTEADCFGRYDDISTTNTRVFQSAFKPGSGTRVGSNKRRHQTVSHVASAMHPLPVPIDDALASHPSNSGVHSSPADWLENSGVHTMATELSRPNANTRGMAPLPQELSHASGLSVTSHGLIASDPRYLIVAAALFILALIGVLAIGLFIGRTGAVAQNVTDPIAQHQQPKQNAAPDPKLNPNTSTPSQQPDANTPDAKSSVKDTSTDAPSASDQTNPKSSDPSADANPQIDKPDPPKVKRYVRPSKAYLRVDSQRPPQARLFVDGHLKGFVPILVRLDAGRRYKIKLVPDEPGYKPFTKTIVLKSSHTKSNPRKLIFGKPQKLKP